MKPETHGARRPHGTVARRLAPGPGLAASVLAGLALGAATVGTAAQNPFWPDAPAEQSFVAAETVRIASPFSGREIDVGARLLVRDEGDRTRVWLLLQSPQESPEYDCSDCLVALHVDDQVGQWQTCASEPYTGNGLKFDDVRALLEAMDDAQTLSITVPVAAMGAASGEWVGVTQRFTFSLADFRRPGRGVSDACDRDLYGE
jgi:hypothetical protein